MFQHIYLFISRCSSLTRTINPEYSVCFLKEKSSLLRVGSLERLPCQPAFCPQKLEPETYSSKTLSMKGWKLSCPQLLRKCQLMVYMALIHLFLPFLFWLHKRKPERTEDIPIPPAASGGRSRCLPQHCPIKQKQEQKHVSSNPPSPQAQPHAFPPDLTSPCLSRAGHGAVPAPPGCSLHCSPMGLLSLQGNLCAWSPSCPAPADICAPWHRGAPLCPAGPGVGWDQQRAASGLSSHRPRCGHCTSGHMVGPVQCCLANVKQACN